jgi:hypothetical protein
LNFGLWFLRGLFIAVLLGSCPLCADQPLIQVSDFSGPPLNINIERGLLHLSLGSTP